MRCAIDPGQARPCREPGCWAASVHSRWCRHRAPGTHQRRSPSRAATGARRREWPQDGARGQHRATRYEWRSQPVIAAAQAYAWPGDRAM